ncbi:MAG: extracellular solute-binding protein [Desulfatibacillaceae bacterium]
MRRICLFSLSVFLLAACLVPSAYSAREVVVYTSVDQIFSEPVLEEFEKATGIATHVLYDVEASKTVGLVNRLIAEKKQPRCDVFWNSEVSRTIVLEQKDVLAPYRSPHWDAYPAHMKDPEYYWTGFAARSRVLLVNTDMLTPEQYPDSMFELTEDKWKGKVTMAYPLFGTTAMHVAAWWSTLGPEKTKDYLRDLKDNDVLIVDGNSVTRDLVVEGKVPVGVTDTDDAAVAVDSEAPVKVIFPDQGEDQIGTLLIPNTVAMVKGAPHPDEAKVLIDYLLSAEMERRLASGESAQMPLRKDITASEAGAIKSMEVDFEKVADYLEPSARFCQELFVR